MDSISKLSLGEDDSEEVSIILMKGTLMVPTGKVQCHPKFMFGIDLFYQLRGTLKRVIGSLQCFIEDPEIRYESCLDLLPFF